jgi:hypothetical protein
MATVELRAPCTGIPLIMKAIFVDIAIHKAATLEQPAVLPALPMIVAACRTAAYALSSGIGNTLPITLSDADFVTRMTGPSARLC